ncbi:hypothetical protein RN001_011800 [Aquatica leii]|uniref:Uncharacterized protein n=1 Tax=Aquatica leii TaxID=1421715 RepID=A0AAN7P4P5_9COLE|nr:hypothetical protein RN001_011800 [Aquatica leii]
MKTIRAENLTLIKSLLKLNANNGDETPDGPTAAALEEIAEVLTIEHKNSKAFEPITSTRRSAENAVFIMHLQHHFQNVCATFLIIWTFSFAVQIPTENFNLDEFLEARITKNKERGFTHCQELTKTKPLLTSTPDECNRVCYERSAPKNCYYKFIIEYYTAVGGACELCAPNTTKNCQCIYADGIERTIIVANRQLPGPSIQVCKDDNVIIDVQNNIDGAEVSLHWHGILQHNSQYYDGVPMLTQCPIHKGNVFRYKWKAENPGTHFWHSHTGFQKIDGLAGSIIVREATDIHQHLYDYDNNILMISDWYHYLANERFPGRLKTNRGQDPNNLLINGKGQFVDPITNISTDSPLEVFYVERGKRYRFRVINACATTCPVHLVIERHKVQVIATDGEPVVPVVADSVISLSAERYDFVLHADQPEGTYWIQTKARGHCEHKKIYQMAILKYKNAPDEPTSKPPHYTNRLFTGKVLNPLDNACSERRTDAICLEQLENAYTVNPLVLKEKPDMKIFLPVKFAVLNQTDVFKPNTFNKYFHVPDDLYLAGLVDGIAHAPPPVPLLSQYKDVNPKQFCNGDTQLESCGLYCHCTHKIDIPLNAVVEVCLVDEVQVNFMYHPFHLHGHTFYVTKIGHLPNASESISLEKVIALDKENKLKRNAKRPTGKDTIAIPNNGYVCLRFIADNPGFWLFHCHFLHHLVVGMAVVFQVGNLTDLPPVPTGFPTCGNFLPDIY